MVDTLASIPRLLDVVAEAPLILWSLIHEQCGPWWRDWRAIKMEVTLSGCQSRKLGGLSEGPCNIYSQINLRDEAALVSDRE